MHLHHFTHLRHLPHILSDGILRVTESNVGAPFAELQPNGLGVGPDVVWLLDVAEPDWSEEQFHGLYPDKRQIRFTVEVSRPIRWLDWSPARDMHPTWRETFIRVGGGLEAAEHWYVHPAPIRRRAWVEIRDMFDGVEINQTLSGVPA